MNPLRVAMIIQAYYPRLGGAERQLAALAPLLQARGVEVHILTRRYPGLAPFELVNGIPVYRLPVPGPKPVASMAFTLAALPRMRQLRPHVIHAHEMFSPATTAIAAKRQLGTPVAVKVLRGGAQGDLIRLRRKAFGGRRLAAFRRQVDAFIVISQEIDRELAEAGVPPERRVFIPNGVDMQRFAPLAQEARSALRAELDLPDGPLAVFTGRLAPEKRVDLLLSVWPAVRAAHPAAALLVIGDGPQAEALRQAAGPGVRLLGAVEDVSGFLRAADLFVLPSATEGLSNALLEALAAGLPAVATAVGGAPDVIEHGRSGWLVPPNDQAALQAGLLAVLDGAAQRDEMGRQARSRIQQDYSLAATADRLRALYDRLIGEAK